MPTDIHTLQDEIIHCRQCERLVAWREQVGVIKRKAYRDQQYWSRPVPGFGDPHARVVVVGLAPGAHGSNRTGRMFTGDDSGNFLYPALHRAGFANQPQGSDPHDALKLSDMWITAVCRCVPPDNKPTSQEILSCRPFLHEELRLQNRLQGIVALGRIAWEEVLKWYQPDRSQPIPTFTHGALVAPCDGKPWILASYHPSRQNTQTGRLTAAMFDAVWGKARELLDQ